MREALGLVSGHEARGRVGHLKERVLDLGARERLGFEGLSEKIL